MRSDAEVVIIPWESTTDEANAAIVSELSVRMARYGSENVVALLEQPCDKEHIDLFANLARVSEKELHRVVSLDRSDFSPGNMIRFYKSIRECRRNGLSIVPINLDPASPEGRQAVELNDGCDQLAMEIGKLYSLGRPFEEVLGTATRLLRTINGEIEKRVPILAENVKAVLAHNDTAACFVLIVSDQYREKLAERLGIDCGIVGEIAPSGQLDAQARKAVSSGGDSDGEKLAVARFALYMVTTSAVGVGTAKAQLMRGRRVTAADIANGLNTGKSMKDIAERTLAIGAFEEIEAAYDTISGRKGKNGNGFLIRTGEFAAPAGQKLASPR